MLDTKDQPLNSDEHIKLVVFTLLMLPTILFGVGVIPVLFLIFGIFMMKKSKSFSHIETAVKYNKIYMNLAFIGLLITTIIFGIMYLESPDYYDDEVIIFSMLSLAPVFYYVALTYLFYKPLSNHQDWVTRNGIFSNNEKADNSKQAVPDVNIIKGEKLKSYSVADELLKWAKLKEDGIISEDDYKQAKDKLLDKA